MPKIVLSVVSHAQEALIKGLLQDLDQVVPDDSEEFSWRLVLTENTNDKGSLKHASASKIASQGRLFTVQNTSPLGFGANHNHAFQMAPSDVFFVLNPDIRIESNVFLTLISHFESRFGALRIGIVAPKIVNAFGDPEDSARYFPSFLGLVCRVWIRDFGRYPANGRSIYFPDWVAGMFLAIDSNLYREVNGFDEKYFMYYEDVDLCLRARSQGFVTAIDTRVQATHFAQRSSHRNFRLFFIHVLSALRFLTR